jgi:hypothetical protein
MPTRHVPDWLTRLYNANQALRNGTSAASFTALVDNRKIGLRKAAQCSAATCGTLVALVALVDEVGGLACFVLLQALTMRRNATSVGAA